MELLYPYRHWWELRISCSVATKSVMNSGVSSGIRMNLSRWGRWTPRISESLRTQFINTVYTCINWEKISTLVPKALQIQHRRNELLYLLFWINVQVVTSQNCLHVRHIQLEKLFRSWDCYEVFLNKFVSFFDDCFTVQSFRKCSNTKNIFTRQSNYYKIGWNLINVLANRRIVIKFINIV